MTDTEKKNIESLHQILHKITFANHFSDVSIFKGVVKDLSEVELMILSFVYNKPDVVLKEISSIFKMPPSTLTSALDRLEKKGYLYRVISKRDRRSYGLKITDKGVAIVEMHMQQEKDSIYAILNTLDSVEEQVTFLRLLQKIVDKCYANIDFADMLNHVNALYKVEL